jgi:hypothetical protein
MAVGVHPVDERIKLAGALAWIGVMAPLQQGWGQQLGDLAQQQVVETQGLRGLPMALHHPVQKRQHAIEALKVLTITFLADRSHQRGVRHPNPPLRAVRWPAHGPAHRLNPCGIHPDRYPPLHVVVGAPWARWHQQQGVTGEVGQAAPADPELAAAPIGHHQRGPFTAFHLPLQPRSPQRHDLHRPELHRRAITKERAGCARSSHRIAASDWDQVPQSLGQLHRIPEHQRATRQSEQGHGRIADAVGGPVRRKGEHRTRRVWHGEGGPKVRNCREKSRWHFLSPLICCSLPVRSSMG